MKTDLKLWDIQRKCDDSCLIEFKYLTSSESENPIHNQTLSV